MEERVRKALVTRYRNRFVRLQAVGDEEWPETEELAWRGLELDPENPRELPSIAWHEAGHAVIYRALGVPVHHVMVQYGNPVTMHAPYGRCAVVQDDAPPEAVILASLAGNLAEKRAVGTECPINDPEEKGRGDGALVAKALDRLGIPESERDAYLRAAEQKAAALLDEHWPKVQAVAEWLLRQQPRIGNDFGFRVFLDAPELEALLASKTSGNADENSETETIRRQGGRSA